MRKLILLLSLFLLAFGMVHADDVVEGREGRAELRFMEGMIDHHQMAIDMAQDCLEKASSDDLKTICQNIIDAQSAEIEQMRGWLLDWYNVDYYPVPMADMEEDHSGHDMDEMAFTDPAMMMGMMAGLNRVEGVEYDIAWAESMIDHHDDAIHMAERLIRRVGDTGHADLKALAEKIIEDQSAEIETLESLIVEWGG
jgi:uncharacterized protein (DUF305 family)